MNTRDEELQAKVKAVNRANAEAMELQQQLKAIFAPLIGHGLFKATGGLLAKYEKLLPKFPCTPHLHVYRHTSPYSLAWIAKTCEAIGDDSGPHTVIYYEASAYVGDLHNGVLTKLADDMTLRTDYTFEEIKAKRAEAERLQSLYEAARNETYPFGPG